MAKTMIVTGWGLPIYGPAAALALNRRFKEDAEVVGASRRHLGEILVRSAESGAKEIFVLGVGLDVEPEKTAAIIAKLRAEKVEVTWISDRKLSSAVAPIFQSHGENTCFSEMLIGDGGDLLSAIQQAFPRVISDKDVEFYRPYAQDKVRSASVEGKYRKLFKAADWMHKTYRDYGPYSRVIRMLAKRQDPDGCGAELKDAVCLYEKWGKRQLLGVSKHLDEVREIVRLAADYDAAEARVFITGPSGTGKETVAQQIHMRSKHRSNGPFLSFNCACTTKELFESKLFGHVKGAFTGADRETKGLFEAAEDGTLFLDEIGELSLELQSFLLRVLQDGEYLKVGSSDPQKVKNVRVITATNCNLAKMVREHKFREDLYHRLNVVQIQMKGLRERPEDIPVIADGLWYRETHTHLTAEQQKALEGYEYPGNARELENMLVRARALKVEDFAELVRQQRICNAELIEDAGEANGEDVTPDVDDADETLESAKRRHVQRIVNKYEAQGVSRRKIASDILRMSENTMRSMLV